MKIKKGKRKINIKTDVGDMEVANDVFNNSVNFGALGEEVENENHLNEVDEKLILDEDSNDGSTSSARTINVEVVDMPKEQVGLHLQRLKQLIEQKSAISLTEAIETHDTLNPALWDENDNLLPEVEEGINKIVDQFVSELKDNEVDLKVIDVVLVGSNASYNYTKDSDLDVHIVADTSIIDCNYGLLPIIYNMARSSFNNKYDISIHGVPIEIYVEGTDTQATSNGIYSMKDGWIKKPVRLDIPEVDISDLYPEWEERAVKLIKDIENYLV